MLLYIIRRTYGFRKNADAISLSQFRKGIKTQDKKVLDKGCGLEHNRTILVALASLEEKGYVIANKGQTNRGDADTTVYKLRFKEASEAQSDDGVITSGNHVVTSSNHGSYPTSPRSLPQVTTVVTSSNQQETVLQDTDSQETVRQEESNVAPESRNAPTSLKEYKQRKETDPQIPVVKPLQQMPAPAKKKATQAEPEIPPEAVRIMDDWDSVLKKPVPRTQGHIDAAILLIPCNPTREELDAVRKWLFTTDRPEKPWYRKIGVHLPDISKNFEKWRSLQEMPSEQQNGKSTGPELGDCGYPKLHPRKPVYPDTNKQEPGKGPRYA